MRTEENVIKKLLSVWFVEDLDYQVDENILNIKTTLSSVIERYVAGKKFETLDSNICINCGIYWYETSLTLKYRQHIYLVRYFSDMKRNAITKYMLGAIIGYCYCI